MFGSIGGVLSKSQRGSKLADFLSNVVRLDWHSVSDHMILGSEPSDQVVGNFYMKHLHGACKAVGVAPEHCVWYGPMRLTPAAQAPLGASPCTPSRPPSPSPSPCTPPAPVQPTQHQPDTTSDEPYMPKARPAASGSPEWSDVWQDESSELHTAVA